MKNDKERMEFVKNKSNWKVMQTAGAYGMDLFRLSKLEYLECYEWFKLEAKQTLDRFNTETRKIEPVTEWSLVNYYRIVPENQSLSYSISATQIVNEIKEIDKERR